jgi:hypothetical protein
VASKLLARHRSRRSSPIVGPGSDSIVVPIPSRAWALCAIEDLRREGMSAELVGQNARSSWLVRIEGPAGSIAEIRFSLQPRAEPVCWEAFVNGPSVSRSTEREG